MGCAATKVSDQQQHDDANNEGGGEDGGVEDGVAVAPVSIEGDATTVESIPVPEGEEKIRMDRRTRKDGLPFSFSAA